MGTIDSQETGNLLSLLCTDVITSLFKIIVSVSKNFGGLVSIVYLVLKW